MLLSILALLAAPNPWEGAEEVRIPCTSDGADQGAMFWVPPGARPGGTPAPLLVALHTWSADYRQPGGYLAACRERGWVLIHPDFRGPNRRPEACASDIAVQDVLDAVRFAREHAAIDPRRIYLCGASGGGYMSLVMAHRAPSVWAGVSAWVPISDLAAWQRECGARRPPLGYAADVERCCGGPPGPATEAEYRRRSPLFHLADARGVPMDLNAGIHDGHTGSVPISHTLRAFNALAGANGRPEAAVSEADIATMVQSQQVPEALAAECEGTPYRPGRILFRRQAGPVRVTLFEGGHQSDEEAAADWLARQTK